MRDDLKREFEKVIADKKLRDEASEQAAARQRNEVDQLQADWIEKISTVVRPALQEIVDDVLRSAGWQTTFVGSGTTLGLEVYKGNMTTAGGSRTRPNVTFMLAPGGKRITVHVATPSLMT